MMKGFDTQEAVNTSSIENWTLLQCKEYLDKYPNGLKALQVKKQLSKLQTIINQKEVTPVFTNKAKNAAEVQSKSNTITSLSPNIDSNVNKNNLTFMNILGLIVLILSLVVFLVSAILGNI